MKLLSFFIAITFFSINTMCAQASVEEMKNNPKLKFIIKGWVKDNSTKKALEGATVLLTGTNGTMAKVTTKKNGKYKFYKNSETKEKLILADEDYHITISKDGYIQTKYTESTQGIYDNEVFEDDIYLEAEK